MSPGPASLTITLPEATLKEAIGWATLLIEKATLLPTLRVAEFTHRLLCLAPLHFWVKGSSSSGKYHPKDEHCTGGLLLHTLRVCEVAERLIETNPALKPQHDLIISACILHDICRYGSEELGTAWTLTNHPELGADFILKVAPRRFASIARPVAQAVASHYGQWGSIPIETPMGLCVHQADNIAAKLTGIQEVGLKCTLLS